jgi:hypothetical protein
MSAVAENWTVVGQQHRHAKSAPGRYKVPPKTIVCRAWDGEEIAVERLDSALEVVARAGGSLPIDRFEGFALLSRGELKTGELLDFGLDTGVVRSPQLRDGLIAAVDRGFLSYDSTTLTLTEHGRQRLNAASLAPSDEPDEFLLGLDDTEFTVLVRQALATA